MNNKDIVCPLTQSIIPSERVEFLRSMGIPEDEMYAVNVSPVQKKFTPTQSAYSAYSEDCEETKVTLELIVGDAEDEKLDEE